MTQPHGHGHPRGHEQGHGHGQGHGHPGGAGAHVPRLIAWEVTRTCPMNCRHCRAAARREAYAGELSTQECFRLLENVASFAKPIIILTGGEPMTRPDIYDIAAHGVKLGLPMVMAPCGLLLNDESAGKIVLSGIRLISISLDGATAKTHDAFRAYEGSFDACMAGIAAAKRAGLAFQINTTVSKHNVEELPALLDLALRLGAKVFNPFLLVPTGRGKDLMAQELSPDEYERTLLWLAARHGRKDMPIRVTCAPHYQRILRQSGCSTGILPVCTTAVPAVASSSSSSSAAAASAASSASSASCAACAAVDMRKEEGTEEAAHGQDARGTHGRDGHATKDATQGRDALATSAPAQGCIGGKAFAFISHVGKVQICGFLDVECGDLRKESLDFRKIWETSEVFRRVRDVDSYGGRCGYCEYRRVCGGCRARAYALTGDYLGEEPFCSYQPRRPGAMPGAMPLRVLAEGHVSTAEDERSRTARNHGQAQRAPAGDARGTHGQDAHATKDLDELDKRILETIQRDFPIVRRPYDVLGEALGAAGGEILRRVARLSRAGYIRRLGAVFDSRRLGYVSTLVAAKVPPRRLDEVADLVSEIAGVTHNYRREHAYNLWFTLTVRSQEEQADVIGRLRRDTGIDDFHPLPALAIYKSDVQFWLSDAPPPNAPAPTTAEEEASKQQNHGQDAHATARPSGPAVTLDDRQKALVRALGKSLPLTEEPFEAVARCVDWPLQAVLDQTAQWIADGVIRRVGAVLAHRRLQFEANGMAVFAAPPDRIDAAGLRMARESRISHCYRRPELADWPYNLFAMVHGRAEAEVRQFVDALARELGLEQYDILFSTREYKKESMRFFTEVPPADR